MELVTVGTVGKCLCVTRRETWKHQLSNNQLFLLAAVACTHAHKHTHTHTLRVSHSVSITSEDITLTYIDFLENYLTSNMNHSYYLPKPNLHLNLKCVFTLKFNNLCYVDITCFFCFFLTIRKTSPHNETVWTDLHYLDKPTHTHTHTHISLQSWRAVERLTEGYCDNKREG